MIRSSESYTCKMCLNKKTIRKKRKRPSLIAWEVKAFRAKKLQLLLLLLHVHHSPTLRHVLRASANHQHSPLQTMFIKYQMRNNTLISTKLVLIVSCLRSKTQHEWFEIKDRIRNSNTRLLSPRQWVIKPQVVQRFTADSVSL